MNINLHKPFTALALVALFAGTLAPAASAYPVNYYNPYYGGGYYGYGYYGNSVFNTHPILSSTLVGTAVGALGGAAVGAIQQADHSSGMANIGTDSAIGAGAGAALGAGVGIIRNHQLTGFYF